MTQRDPNVDPAERDEHMHGGSQPNRYRDLHRAVDSLANQASGLGLLSQASTLWAVAASIKEEGVAASIKDEDRAEQRYQDETEQRYDASLY